MKENAMAEEVATTATEQALANLEELADALYDSPGPRYFATHVLGSTTISGTDFWRLRQDRWRLVGPDAPGREPLLKDAVQPVSDYRIQWSPFLHFAPATGSLMEQHLIVVRIAIPEVPPEQIKTAATDMAARGDVLRQHLAQLRNEKRVDFHARMLAWDRLRTLPLLPNAVIDSADVMYAVWKLDEPLKEHAFASFAYERSHAVWAAHRIATMLGQSASFAHEPGRIWIDAPGVIRLDVRMGAHVATFRTSATLLRDSPYTFEEVEAFSKAGRVAHDATRASRRQNVATAKGLCSPGPLHAALLVQDDAPRPEP
jgi:hypothetical protein